MQDLMYKVFDIMNQIKGFTVGYSANESKLLFEKDGKLYVMECREVDQSYTHAPKDIHEVMRRIKYL
jgi:hypothetical protein